MASSNQIKSGWSWQKKLKRAVEVLREEGIKSFWFKLLSEIGYRRVLWLKRSLEEPIPEIKSPLPVTVGLLQKTEVEEYIKFHSELQPSCIVSWLDAGHRCFVERASPSRHCLTICAQAIQSTLFWITFPASHGSKLKPLLI